MRLLRWLALFCLPLLLVTLAAAQGRAAQQRWQWRNPLPQGNSFVDVAFGGGLFLGVGEEGAVFTSADGARWAERRLPQSGTLRAAAYGNGRYLVVGAGIAFTSPDGLSWQAHTGWGTYDLLAVTYGAGQFVAVARNMVLTSPDGVQWRERAGARGLSDIAFGDGRFVAVGEEEILTSTDGASWERAALSGPMAVAVTHGHGLFVATAFLHGAPDGQYYTILTSADGVSWEKRRPAGEDDFAGAPAWPAPRYKAIAYGSGRFVAAGTHGKVIYSANGTDWSGAPRVTTAELRGVAYGNGTFVAAGAGGAVIAAPDGVVWTERSGGAREHLQGVTYGDRRFVAVGEKGRILTSAAGEAWDSVASGVTAALRGAAYGNGLYVAVGDGGTVLTSPDGTGWTRAAAPTQANLYAVTYGERRFVAVGADSAVLTSSDGASWTAVAGLPQADLKAVAFGGGQFVAVGSALLNSRDGQTWSQVPEGRGDLVGVTYGLGRFLTVGAEGAFGISLDGQEWFWEQMIPGPEARRPLITSVGYGNGWFVALGQHHYLAPNSQNWQSAPAAFFSGTGELWGPERLPPTGYLSRGLAYGNGRYVAVGDMGHILTAATDTSYPDCRELFADLLSGHPACGAVRRLAESGAIGGYPDGTFRPAGPVTRAEFAKMLTVALNRPLEPGAALPFSDTAGHWGAQGGYLQAAYNMNQRTGYWQPVISGYADGTFRPDVNIRRAELAKLVAVASRRYPGGRYVWSPYFDVAEEDWFAVHVGMTYRDRITGPEADTPMWLGLMLGPQEFVSRGEAAVIIDNLRMAAPEAAKPTAQMTVEMAEGGALAFEPHTLQVRLGEEAELLLINRATAQAHSLVIPELNFKSPHVAPGQRVALNLKPGRTGTFRFFCDVPGHKDAGMVGLITVTPG